MMREAFDREMDLLEAFFPMRGGEQARQILRAQWWDLFYREDQGDFVEAVGNHIKKGKYFPKPAEIFGFLSWLQEQRATPADRECEDGALCPRCEGAGWIPFFQITSTDGIRRGHQVVARCSCPKGQRMGGGGRSYDELFPDEPHRTHGEYVDAMFRASAAWDRERGFVQVPIEDPDDGLEREPVPVGQVVAEVAEGWPGF